MNDPTELQVIGALEQSGYLFEHEVATRLEELGFHVETSWAYLDPDSEKSREIDVRAIREVARDEVNKVQIFVELLVECKASESPLVFLERKKNERELSHAVPKEYLFPRPTYTKRLSANSFQEISAFAHLQLRDKHYYFREENKATQFAKIVRKGSDWIANHDGVYDSLILPMAKLLEFRQAQALKNIRSNEWKAVWLFFPMVVLRDHLYGYDLSRAERKLEPRGRVTFVRNLESGNLKGFYLTDFLTYAHLDRYVREEVFSFSEAVSKIMQVTPRALLDDNA